MIRGFVKFLHYLEEIALAYVSLGLAVLMVLEILLRSTGIISFYWLEELGRLVLVFITLAGANLALRYGAHPSMTALVTALPPKASHIFMSIVYLFATLLFGYLSYYAWGHIWHVYQIGMQTSTLGVPFYVAYLPIGFFFFFICVRYVLFCASELQALGWKNGRTPPSGLGASNDSSLETKA